MQAPVPSHASTVWYTNPRPRRHRLPNKVIVPFSAGSDCGPWLEDEPDPKDVPPLPARFEAMRNS
jgi:hypothetical protein